MLASSSVINQKVRLSDRLAATRHQYFVGRTTELALFQASLQDEVPTFPVLYLYGAGGIGKTTLLFEYARRASAIGIPVVLLDGRHIDPSPSGFMQALSMALGVQMEIPTPEALSDYSRITLLIDTYEVLAPIDEWLREEFLPHLTAQSMIVIAGRNPPADAWRTSLAWSAVTRVVPLRNLSPEESKTFLLKHHIPEKQHASVLAFTHGHPLALALVTDVLLHDDKKAIFIPENEPDVVRMLLNRFLQHVPSQKHRQALEICAHVRVTTESLLMAILESDEAPAIFEWLRGLSFIEQGAQGIFPHDLVREILDADLRWRNPESYRQMHHQARNYYLRQLQMTTGPTQQNTMADMMFMHRNNPFMQPYYDYKSLGTAYAEPADAKYHPSIVEMVRQYEGEDSAQIVQYWMRRQPEAFVIFLGNCKKIVGFTTFIAVHKVTAEDLAFDPGIRSVWNFVQRHGPVRPGEEALYQRFWMGSETYQAAGTAADLVHITGGAQLFSNPKLAWTFIACADPAYWRPMYAYINFHYSPETQFTIGSRPFGVFHHDWRTEPLLSWWEVMGERELASGFQMEKEEAASTIPLIVLSEPEFASAVRDALKNYHRTSTLARNPLMRSRIVYDTSGGTPTVAVLQMLIDKSVEALAVHPKDERLHRALCRTYIKSALTQEDAAESLSLPFSTYRYHLTQGIKRITEWLWQRELYGFEV